MILTAAAMARAEAAAIAAGTSAEKLMERAGAAIADAVLRFEGPKPVLVLAGPGNNGGDGYVAAHYLAAKGVSVRVAALGEPGTAASRSALGQWGGEVEQLDESTAPAPILLDALFGSGLKRGLDEQANRHLARLADAAQVRVACDVPSGIDSDSGAELSPVPTFDLTIACGTLKPAHRLFPAMVKCGRVAVAEIGIDAASDWIEIAPPIIPPLDPAGHKYTRGMVHCAGGVMPGAVGLGASAAARAGAGYVRIDSDQYIPNVPAAVIQGQVGSCDDPRIGALLVGPGLGRDGGTLLDKVLASGRPLVLDGDVFALLGDPKRLHGLNAILTPHQGEFVELFGKLNGSKPERALAAARIAQSIVVYKGPDTLVAAPDGRLAFAPPAPAWLASAGSGDVLAGITAAMRARGLPPFEAACTAVWLHGRAAEIAGPQMIADDLAAAIPGALALL